MLQNEDIKGCIHFWEAQLAQCKLIVGDSTRSLVDQTIEALKENLDTRIREDKVKEMMGNG